MFIDITSGLDNFISYNFHLKIFHKYFDLIDVSLNEEALRKIKSENIKKLVTSSKKASVSASEKGYKVKGKLL